MENSIEFPLRVQGERGMIRLARQALGRSLLDRQVKAFEFYPCHVEKIGLVTNFSPRAISTSPCRLAKCILRTQSSLKWRVRLEGRRGALQ